MEPDAYGFQYPVVDTGACIGCGVCDSVCPVLSTRPRDGCKSVRWARTIDKDLLDRSSSGGVFGLLARDTLACGGVVVGAAWGEGCRELRHIVVDDTSELDSVMRSKYVQSSVDHEVYERVRSKLLADRPVLFAGTACQVAGMRGYLGVLADSGSFLGVDVICHGVPSPELWRRWLDWHACGERAEIDEVNFRSKTTGWLSYSVLYKYRTEKDASMHTFSTIFSNDWYMRAFLSNASLRPSCFRCLSKRSCGSDITLGDFWGIQSAHPAVPFSKGVSAVLINTPKGTEAFDRIAPRIEYGPSSYEKILAGNSALESSVKPFRQYKEFMNDLSANLSKGKMTAKWNFDPSFGMRLYSFLGKTKHKVFRIWG